MVLCRGRLQYGGASEISVYHQIGRGIIQVSFFARVALRVDFRFENSVAVRTKVAGDIVPGSYCNLHGDKQRG